MSSFPRVSSWLLWTLRVLLYSLGWEDPLEKEWQLTPVFLPGKLQGQRSLVGYCPWDHKESGKTEPLTRSPRCLICDLPPPVSVGLRFLYSCHVTVAPATAFYSSCQPEIQTTHLPSLSQTSQKLVPQLAHNRPEYCQQVLLSSFHPEGGNWVSGHFLCAMLRLGKGEWKRHGRSYGLNVAFL